MTPEFEVEDIKVNQVLEPWKEHDITENNTPKVGFNILYCNKGAKLSPEDMYLNLDVTEELMEHIQQGKKSFSIRLSRAEGKHALRGTAPIGFYSRENGHKAPSLNIQMLLPEAKQGQVGQAAADGGGRGAAHHDLW